LYGWSRLCLKDAEHALRQHNLNAAQSKIQQSLHLWPWDARAKFLAAQTARRRDAHGDAERLLTAYESAVGESSESKREWTLLGVQQGDFEGQERALWELVNRKHPDSTLILEALAKGYFNTHNGSDMMECLKLILEADPGHVPAIIWRAKLSEGRHSIEDTLDNYELAVELAPESVEARLGFADALNRLGRPREAVYHFEVVRQQYPDNLEALLGLARCRFDAHEWNEAERLLDELLAARPDHLAGLIERGRLALRQEQWADAERWLTRATDLAPWHREGHKLLSLSLEAQNKSDELRRCQERMQVHELSDKEMVQLRLRFRGMPRDAQVRYEIGRWGLENGDETDGVRWLFTALLADSNHGPTHAALADYFERAGQPRRAAWHRTRVKQ